MKISNDSAPSSIHRPNTAVGAHYLRLAADRGSPEAQVPPSPPRTRTRFVLAVGRSDGRGRGQCWLATVLMDVAGDLDGRDMDDGVAMLTAGPPAGHGAEPGTPNSVAGCRSQAVAARGAAVALWRRAAEVGHARAHCRFALPVIHFIPDALTYSVPLYFSILE